MKANKKTLLAVKNYLQMQEGWDLDEVKEGVVEEINLLKTKEMGEHTLAPDECGIEWDKKEVCVLSEFIDKYTSVFIERICNVLDSFVGEDISCYLEEDE